jgi:hypothetical protein
MKSDDAARKSHRKTTSIFVAALCVATGFIAAFRAMRNASAKFDVPSHPAKPQTNHRSSATAAPDLAAPEFPPPLPALAETSPALVRRLDQEDLNVSSLPPPPTGDYDLTLSPERIAAVVEARYGGLFPSLGLSAARLGRLRTLLGERQQLTIDAANAALLFGLNPIRDLPEILLGIERFQAGADSAIRDEFGEAIFAVYRDFESTLRERNSVADLRRLVEADQEPLRLEQEERLIRLLRESPARGSPLNLGSVIYGGLNERAPISAQALAAARAVLSPLQWERLRQLQASLSVEADER